MNSFEDQGNTLWFEKIYFSRKVLFVVPVINSKWVLLWQENSGLKNTYFCNQRTSWMDWSLLYKPRKLVKGYMKMMWMWNNTGKNEWCSFRHDVAYHQLSLNWLLHSLGYHAAIFWPWSCHQSVLSICSLCTTGYCFFGPGFHWWFGCVHNVPYHTCNRFSQMMR